MDGVANNRYAVLTHVLKNDGTKTDEFLEWRCKLCVSLSIYNEAIYILQEQERPWETDDDHGTARGSWDAAKLDLFSVLSFSTGGSAFFIARRFEDTTPEDEARYGPLAWATLRETFKGISHEAVRAEHAKINNTRICSGQEPDEYRSIMGSCRDRLNAFDPPQGPTHRQYEDIIFSDLPPEYKVLRQAHLERSNSSLADIPNIMTVIYADNLARSHSDSVRGISGRGAAIQAMVSDRSDIKCHICDCNCVRQFKSNCPLRFKHQQQNDGQHPQQREDHQNNPRKQHQRNGEDDEVPPWCSYRITTTHSVDDCCALKRKRADGNVHVAAAGPSRVTRIWSAHDFPEVEDQPERPYIYFTATMVHPAAAALAEQCHKAATWPFGSLPVSRSWQFEECVKLAISLRGQENRTSPICVGE